MKHSTTRSRADVPTPLVTIAIPTYNRPSLLRRAIRCAVEQDYSRLEILISDNSSDNDASDDVVSEFMETDPRIFYYKQDKTTKSIANFLFLLDKATGKYFMWLGDDDSISTNFVSALVALHQSQNSLSCAWASHRIYAKTGEVKNRLVEYSSNNRIARAFHYILRPEDAFIYGLFETDYLRSVRWRWWSWPNKDIMTNLAHPVLFEMVCLGRVVASRNSTVLYDCGCNNRVYYKGRVDGRIKGNICYAIRRLNFYFEFLRRAMFRQWWGVSLLVISMFPFAFMRDIGGLVYAHFTAHLGRIKNKYYARIM